MTWIIEVSTRTHVDKRKEEFRCARAVDSDAYLACAFAVEDPPYADSGKSPLSKSVSVT